MKSSLIYLFILSLISDTYFMVTLITDRYRLRMKAVLLYTCSLATDLSNFNLDILYPFIHEYLCRLLLQSIDKF